MTPIAFLLKYLEPGRIIFEHSCKDPLKAQTNLLLSYLKRNRSTEFGIKHNFSSIRSVDGFRSSVPIAGYEAVRPHIERMAAGENNILTKDKVLFFGATSGTTSKTKLVPTTAFSEKKKESLLNLWSYYVVRDHPGVLSGKILAIVSPETEGMTSAGIPFGAESGYSYKNLPKIISGSYSLPYDVFRIEDYEARHYTILRISLEHNISTIISLNPNTIVLLLRKIARWCDILIEDIAMGSLSDRFAVSPEIRSVLTKRFKPNPKRAEKLRTIMRDKGSLLPKYFWPDIKTIECWQGGMMKLYLNELDHYFGDIPKRDIGCVSTEARTSVPIRDNTAQGVLAIRTNFYEFIPKEDIGKKDVQTLLCTELSEGREYFIIVTTAGGLYRYNIDDVIKVTGFFKNTPMIEFVQKGSGATSLAGEKLYESHVNDAMSGVMKERDVHLDFFCAVARPMDGPRYDLLVEFSQDMPAPAESVMLLESIDSHLRRQNREYDYVRQAQLLAPPALKILKKGSFEKYRSKRISEGAQEGQFKAPELTADADFEDNFETQQTIRITPVK